MCVVMGPTHSVRRDMTCLVLREMLYMTGWLGAFDMCKMQRVNRNLLGEQSENDHGAQRFVVLQRGRLEITSRVNGMIRGN
jgi:hypothetical protein